MINITYPLTIYYDASCPMCKSEMDMIKEGDKDKKLILVDCSNTNFSTAESCPVTKEAMMERIHAIDANGIWINSVDVFAAAYSATGHEKISKFWSNKTLQPLLSKAYPMIASQRGWLSKTPFPYMFNLILKLISRA